MYHVTYCMVEFAVAGLTHFNALQRRPREREPCLCLPACSCSLLLVPCSSFLAPRSVPVPIQSLVPVLGQGTGYLGTWTHPALHVSNPTNKPLNGSAFEKSFPGPRIAIVDSIAVKIRICLAALFSTVF